MRRLLLCLVLVATSLFAGVSPVAASPKDRAADFLSMMNAYRAENGRRPLAVSSVLTSVAFWRAKDMVARSYISHTIPLPPGGKVFNELHRRGYFYRAAGENLAANTLPSNLAVSTALAGFIASAPHRALLLGAWTRVGVGVGYSYERTTWYFVILVSTP